ncbi:MAG: ATP-binding protein [Bacteroidia bacterium]
MNKLNILLFLIIPIFYSFSKYKLSDKDKLNIDFEKSLNLTAQCLHKLYAFDTINTLKLFDKIIEYDALKQNYITNWFVYYTKAAIQSDLFFNTDSGIFYADKALDLALKNYDRELMIRSYIKKIDLLERIKDDEMILEYSYRISDLLKENKGEINHIDIFHYFNRIGTVYFREGYTELALYNFKIALLKVINSSKIYSDYEYWIQNILNNIGMCYEEQGNYQKAEKYYKLAIINSKKSKNIERALGVNYASLAALYHKQKKYADAEKFYRKALNFALKFENREIEHGIGSLLRFSDLLIELNRLNEADSALSNAFVLINNYNVKHHLKVYNYTKSKIESKKGNYKLSNNYLINYIKLLDEENIEKRKFSAAKILMTKNLRNIENENRNLEAKLAIEKSTSFVYRIFSITVFIFFLIIFIILYRQHQNNKKLAELNYQIEESNTNLKQINRKLESLNKQKTYLINTVAHDLRNPIRNINVLCDFIDKVNLNKEDLDVLKMIKTSSVNASIIVEDILDQALIENATIKLTKKKIDLAVVVKETIDLVYYMSRNKNIDINFEHVGDFWVLVDESRISRVIQNLLTNAIKYSEANSKVYIELKKVDKHVLLTVKDYGVGIPREKLTKIFEPFTKYNSTGTASERSYGLGLSITKKIVELHNGKIDVESEPGKGAKFMVTIPITT